MRAGERSAGVGKTCYYKEVMKYRYLQNQEHTNYSRTNRNNQTDAEKLLWSHLRRKQIDGLKFRRQYPIANYILDFYCSEKKLAIELDGSQHMQNSGYDEKRAQILQKHNIEIMRFWDNEVLQNIDGVLQVIYERLTLSPKTSP